MKKLSLILFTILSQATVGAFSVTMVIHLFPTSEEVEKLISLALITCSVIMICSLIIALGHLGSPLIAFKTITNVRSSWLSREVFLAALFTGLCLVTTYLQLNPIKSGKLQIGIGWTAGIVGLLFIYAMGKLYMLKTISWWNSFHTPLSFFITAFILGGLIVDLSLLITISENRVALYPEFLKLFTMITGSILLLLCFEFILVPTRMIRLLSESDYQKDLVQNFLNQFEVIYYLRLLVTIIGFVTLSIILFTQSLYLVIYLISFGLLAIEAFLGRYLFYAEQESSSL